MKTRESSGQAAAAEKIAKFVLDEPRQPFAVPKGGRLRAERLEVFKYQAVQPRCAAQRGS